MELLPYVFLELVLGSIGASTETGFAHMPFTIAYPGGFLVLQIPCLSLALVFLYSGIIVELGWVVF